MGALFPYKSLAWIGYMSIEPTFQGKGIGTAIFQDLLELAEQLAIPTIRLDATENGRKVYLKFGFKDQYPSIKADLNTDAKIQQTPEQTSEFIIQDHKSLPDWILTHDRQVFGADRSLLLKYLALSGKMIMKEKESYGFLCDNKIGPIIAKNYQSALKILQTGMNLGANNVVMPLHPDIPKEFYQAIPLKIESEHRGTRMIWGKQLKEKPKQIFMAYTFATG
jgi:hypothetical protein